MNEFIIRIVETLATSVIVEADSADDAIDKARDLYMEGEIVLTCEDYIDTDFEESVIDLELAKKLSFSKY